MAVDFSEKRLSTKKTLPNGASDVRTMFQKFSKRSSGTCESQKPKKTASYVPSGIQLN